MLIICSKLFSLSLFSWHFVTCQVQKWWAYLSLSMIIHAHHSIATSISLLHRHHTLTHTLSTLMIMTMTILDTLIQGPRDRWLQSNPSLSLLLPRRRWALQYIRTQFTADFVNLGSEGHLASPEFLHFFLVLDMRLLASLSSDLSQCDQTLLDRSVGLSLVATWELLLLLFNRVVMVLVLEWLVLSEVALVLVVVLLVREWWGEMLGWVCLLVGMGV